MKNLDSARIFLIPAARNALAITRSAVSFAALAGGFACLGWLAFVTDAIGFVSLGVWQTPGQLTGRAPVVVVDAGHGGHDGGAVAGGLVEKDLALELARQVGIHLRRAGIEVVMTRDTDVFLSLEERSARPEQHEASAFVSLHLNTSIASPEVSGIETYFSTQKPLSVLRRLQTRMALAEGQPFRDERGAALARSVQQHVCKATGGVDRGIRERAYAVVANTSCPAVLVECGFLTHEKEAAQLRTAEYRDCVAEGVARGVVEFLQIEQAHPLHGIQALAEPASAMANGGAQ